MESSNNPEVPQTKPEPPKIINTEVSAEVWENLLHTAIVGNGIFPQSFLAQGILLADRMANLVKEKKTSLDALQKENPTLELIFDMMGKAGSKSHNAYGLKTSSGMMGESIISVLINDKNHAQDTLMSFAEVIHGPDSDVSQQNKYSPTVIQETLHKVFSNPQEFSILLEMLRIAKQSLLSPEIRAISNSYKRKIAEFMHKYSEYDFDNIPEGYHEDRYTLIDALKEMLKGATSSVKGDLFSYVKRQHPQNRILSERLEKSDINKLLGGVSVSDINPLRNRDYDE